ncbi:ATP synthase F1 subcomplex epsilon subunit [Kytococcus aerolatus]|uniref:ATP synthase epsilon chain n=1 Tax=Kytococcus aerolatus TaxID=592308 RepID=A0A212T646_9MICO|nr:F0F1 ATP synthase subunit epsilon [Kytococcus aerolatus]SNC61508.1 ATP synthase F1 subcomplex epsilon subunit [Kytococcus aerolatus]
MSQLTVDLVAADRQVWSGEASMVTARTTDGELGIMPGHTPLLGALTEGTVGIHTAGGKQEVQINTGFLSVDSDRVTIVAEQVDASTLPA